jgi:hypothetical protein
MMMASVVKGGAVGAQPDEAASTLVKAALGQDDERSDSLAKETEEGSRVRSTIYSPIAPRSIMCCTLASWRSSK